MSIVLAVGAAVLLVIGLVLLAWIRLVKRWRHGMNLSDDPGYAARLATLSTASVRQSFDAYTAVDWDATEFTVTDNDPRWVLPESDALGRHPWYRAQPLDKQIAIGMWRYANTFKGGIQFEDILIRGLMHYAFWVPNGSPEFRYCVHETIEECNHTLMFQETVNRIGVDVPGMPRWLRWMSPLVPVYAGPLPRLFFFGVLAGEVPYDYLQTKILREDGPVHPIVRETFAIHVAEEARHIAFGHQYLRRGVPQLWWTSRFVLSLYVPVVMRVLGKAIVVPQRSFFRKFGVPRSVRRQMLFGSPDAHQAMRDMFADTRMLCHDVGLMNPAARLMWRICRLDGRPARYRHEPQRGHQSQGRRHSGAVLHHRGSDVPAQKQDATTPV